MSGCDRLEARVAGSDGGHQDGGFDGGHQDGGFDGGRQDGGGGSGGGRQDGGVDGGRQDGGGGSGVGAKMGAPSLSTPKKPSILVRLAIAQLCLCQRTRESFSGNTCPLAVTQI